MNRGRIRYARLLVILVACCAMVVGLCACQSNSSSSASSVKMTPKVSTPAIGTSGVLRVGVDTSDNSPYAAVSSGQTVGIDVDAAAAIADNLGLKLELVEVDSADAATALNDGTIDVMMGMSSSTTSSDVSTTMTSYLDSGTVLFSSKQGASIPSTGSTDKIACMQSSKSAWAVENSFGADKVTTSTSVKEAFKMLKDGEVSYVACDGVTGAYLASAFDVEAYPIALLGSADRKYIGVASSNTTLLDAVNQAVSDVKDNGILELVQKKWFGSVLDVDSLTPVSVTTVDTMSNTVPETANSVSTAGANAMLPSGMTVEQAEAAGMQISSSSSASER